MKQATEAGRQEPAKLNVNAPEITGLLEALPGYVLLIDEEHRILQTNKAAREIFGIDTKDIIGGYCPKVIHGSDKVWPGCPLEEVIQKGQPVEREVFDEKSGRWLESTISPVQGTTPDGHKIFLHTVTDITAVKQAEKIKDEFLGMVSHELKTPLTIIIGALNTAHTPGISTADVEELLKDALDSAGFLAGMVENLLELSRAKNIRSKIKTEQIDFGEIAWGVAHKFNLRSPKHKICLDMPARLPDIAVDKAKVERILFNLVENAVKFSPTGGEITIAARREGRSLQICISDQGSGITGEDQKRLFQSFEQLASERIAMQGLGLGLSACRALVEAHGGKIWVESNPGRGSNFIFTLPLWSSN
ncbi:MAG: ATP-binding protein [Dehalococcoidales bacterium]|nr:ATP-binding protein [Dehalococcoidales bacterium]